MEFRTIFTPTPSCWAISSADIPRDLFFVYRRRLTGLGVTGTIRRLTGVMVGSKLLCSQAGVAVTVNSVARELLQSRKCFLRISPLAKFKSLSLGDGKLRHTQSNATIDTHKRCVQKLM